jgi:hypothetical protein
MICTYIWGQLSLNSRRDIRYRSFSQSLRENAATARALGDDGAFFQIIFNWSINIHRAIMRYIICNIMASYNKTQHITQWFRPWEPIVTGVGVGSQWYIPRMVNMDEFYSPLVSPSLHWWILVFHSIYVKIKTENIDKDPSEQIGLHLYSGGVRFESRPELRPSGTFSTIYLSLFRKIEGECLD